MPQSVDQDTGAILFRHATLKGIPDHVWKPMATLWNSSGQLCSASTLSIQVHWVACWQSRSNSSCLWESSGFIRDWSRLGLTDPREMPAGGPVRAPCCKQCSSPINLLPNCTPPPADRIFVAGLKLCRAQCRLRSSCSTNLYGPHDNDQSINAPSVTSWGIGTRLRSSW
jgi:hypothetical protein